MEYSGESVIVPGFPGRSAAHIVIADLHMPEMAGNPMVAMLGMSLGLSGSQC